MQSKTLFNNQNQCEHWDIIVILCSEDHRHVQVCVRGGRAAVDCRMWPSLAAPHSERCNQPTKLKTELPAEGINHVPLALPGVTLHSAVDIHVLTPLNSEHHD